MPKEIIVYANFHKGNNLIPNDYFSYKFFIVKDGIVKNISIKRKEKESTIDIYEKILTNFFVDKKLISISYDYKNKIRNQEERLGIKLENDYGDKLSVYATSSALDVIASLEKLIEPIKKIDYLKFVKRIILIGETKKIVMKPSCMEKSAIVNVTYNNFYQNQLGYYYQNINGKILESDLWLICTIIREFINNSIINNEEVTYLYTKSELFIRNNSSYIEISDSDLIRELEHNRIIDDLWLVNKKVIDCMPTQEESMTTKENLKRKREIYLKNFS